jgi:S1-C subfamily serine protease
VRNLEDYTFALRKRKPGDVVEIVVVREGRQVTLSATLEKRGE